MALPEPPPNVPRIAEVQDPGTGHYVVLVRMPTQLAAKYPDKPWGTAIEDIGLAPKDSDQYPGYTLVDVQPLKGSPDLYWIFQKLDGPIWTTKSVGQDSLVPAKYRRLVTTTRTKQEVVPDTEPDTIAAPLIASTVEQQEDTGKAIKVNTEEEIAEDTDPIVGQQFDPKGAIMDSTETVVEEGTSADVGLNVSQSGVDAFGDGKAAKVTQTPRRRVLDGEVDTTEEGWPKGQVRIKGNENKVPEKFRHFVSTKTTVEQIALEVDEVDDIPEPPDLVDNEIRIKHEKVNDWRYQRETTTEVINESVLPLNGEEYGDIVTKSVEESLVAEGIPTDDGLDVIESVVDPLGNGKAVKRTKRVKTGSWPNPVEQASEKSAQDAIPEKFRRQITRRKTTRKLAPNDVPAEIVLEEGEISKAYKKETPDRVEETVVSEELDLSEDPFVSRAIETSFGGVAATITEELLGATEDATSGFNVLDSSVTDVGGGKFVKRTAVADDVYPELYGQNYLSDLDITIPFTKQVVQSIAQAPEKSDVDPIDAWRVSRKTVDTVAIQNELADIHLIYPTQENISLPDVLKSIGVKATRVLSNGNSASKGSSGSTENSSSVSVSADVFYEIEEGYSGPAPAEVHVFFLPQGASGVEEILQKIGAEPWPLYRPISSRITIGGMGLTKRFGLSRSSSGWSASESSDVQAFSNVAVIPATIHGELPVEITYDDHIAPTGFLDQFLDTNLTTLDALITSIRNQVTAGQGIFFGTSAATAAGRAAIIAHLDAMEAQINFYADLSIDDASVSVSPDTLEATNVQVIAPAKYVKNSSVSLYGYGMVKVTAVVVDTTSL